MDFHAWFKTRTEKVGIGVILLGLLDWCARFQFVAAVVVWIFGKRLDFPFRWWVSPSLLLLGFVILWVGHKRSARNESVQRHVADLWLGFDGAGGLLCVQNKGIEPIFNVRVKIPEDGRCFTSPPINRIDQDGSAWPVANGTREAIRKAVANAVWNRQEGTDTPVPVCIEYSTRDGRNGSFKELEISLPFTSSSFRRRSSSN